MGKCEDALEPSLRTIEAMIISCAEPQVEKCVRSVREQTIPFSKIVHVDGVYPESDAINHGWSQTSDEWVMKIDGDFILYPDAVELALKYMDRDDERISTYSFGLYDEFMKSPLCGCAVYRRYLAVKEFIYPNLLADDVWLGDRLKRRGWKRKKPYVEGICIGTHFQDPDDFQIFRRFYATGVKHGRRRTWRHLRTLSRHTRDQRYSLAIQALDFGTEKRYYPTSHNIEFDRKIYEEFKEQCKPRS